MIVVADTCPINYLILIDEIDIIPRLFVHVLVPTAVWDELAADGSPGPIKDWVKTNPAWIDVKSPTRLDSTIKLGTGEVEAISLAKEVKADLVLIDDRKARNAAIDRGLAVAGTINVLEAAAKRGLAELPRSFQNLLKTNFRIAPHLLNEIWRRNS